MGATNYFSSNANPAHSFPEQTNVLKLSVSGSAIGKGAPVILANGNQQYIFVLVYKGNKMTLQRYDYSGANNIKESVDFAEVSFDLSTTHQMHQMALHVDPVTGTPFVYVAHDNGLAKVDALSGTQQNMSLCGLSEKLSEGVKPKGVRILLKDKVGTRHKMYVQVNQLFLRSQQLV